MAEYKDMTLEELRALPESQGIEGHEEMSHDELVSALESSRSSSDSEEEAPTAGESEAFDAAQESVESAKDSEEELRREDQEVQDSEREPKTESQERAQEIAGEDVTPQDVGFASEASDRENPEVRSGVADQAKLDQLSDEEAALADVALDASGPLHLEAPSERKMVGALTPEEAELQLERTKDLPEDHVGEIRGDGAVAGREARKGSGPHGEVLPEDVIDFPPPLQEVEEGNQNQSDNRRARSPQISTDVRESRAASEVFPNEGETVAKDRLFQQRGQFYTDGLSGQADHNLAMSYRVHDLKGGNYHVNPTEGNETTAAQKERVQMEKDRLNPEGNQGQDQTSEEQQNDQNT